MPQSHGHRVEDVHFPEETQSGQMPLLRHGRKRFYSSHSSSLRVGPTGTREAPSSECMTRLGRESPYTAHFDVRLTANIKRFVMLSLASNVKTIMELSTRDLQ